MRINADNNKQEMLGNIAALGQGGSGKTRMVNAMANYLSGKELYSWDEEKNMAGTIGVTPYSLKFPNSKRIIIYDNPGQDSFEKIRQMVANQGNSYQGFIICLDAIGWNFRNISIDQLKSMREGCGDQDIVPISVIISKRDIRDNLMKTFKIKELSKIIANAIKNTKDSMEIPFHDRVYNKKTSIKLHLKTDLMVPFTLMEQIIINAIEFWLKKDPINGFTTMNIRLLTRSFLLGYCEAMKLQNLEDFPIFASLADPNLINRLNYHRPSALESGSGWEKLSGKNKNGELNISEPPVLRDTLEPRSVEIILRNFVMVSDSKIYDYIVELNKLGQIYKWQVVSHTFTNSISAIGKEKIKNCLVELLQDLEIRKQMKDKLKAPEDNDTIFGLDQF